MSAASRAMDILWHSGSWSPNQTCNVARTGPRGRELVASFKYSDNSWNSLSWPRWPSNTWNIHHHVVDLRICLSSKVVPFPYVTAIWLQGKRKYVRRQTNPEIYIMVVDDHSQQKTPSTTAPGGDTRKLMVSFCSPHRGGPGEGGGRSRTHLGHWDILLQSDYFVYTRVTPTTSDTVLRLPAT